MYKIYFAGDLFDQKHITGNLFLAQKIEKLSCGLFKCMLPQNWEGSSLNKPLEIRNKDIRSIIQADLVLFNFDGTDLDSGTVVEFVLTKMLDIPAVLLRTDFRAVFLTDQDWNLMATGYPRCMIVKHNALLLYNTVGLEEAQNVIAQSVVDSFKKVMQESSLLTNYGEIFTAYQHVIKMCGGQLAGTMPVPLVQKIIEDKIEKKIYISTEHIIQKDALKVLQ